MRLCVPTSWEDALIDQLAAASTADATIHEVFGSLARSVTGSGRGAEIVPEVPRQTVRRHIDAAHAHGIKFNYLMNASSMGGREFTPEGRDALLRYIEWVAEVGADSLTIAIPLLAELVQKAAPNLEIVVSTISHVDSVHKAAFWRDLGARRVTLSLMANRDFALLGALRKHGGLEIELLANELCLYQCPYREYHYDLMSHGSQEGACVQGDYPNLKCTLERMNTPGELLKARFIRPEDVARYEERGIDLIKLAGRGRGTDKIMRAVRGYVARRYSGNFVDLSDLGMYDTPGVDAPKIHIDNRALDGFLDRVAAIDCRTACGASCRLCDTLAETAVRIEGKDAYLRALERSHGAVVQLGLRKPVAS